MTTTAVDNDVLLKGTCYDLLEELVGTIPAKPDEVGVLGAAPYVVVNSLRKKGRCTSGEEAVARLESFLENVTIYEPTQEELSLAAELEHTAQRAGVNLDGGESQLSAMTLFRGLAWLVTGDKRAVAALGCLRERDERLAPLDGKVLCLEQLFARLLAGIDPKPIRDAVCGEPNVDQALTICFSCRSPEVGPDQWREGLESYIANARNTAKTLLAA